VRRVAAEKAAQQPGARTAATVNDARQPAVRGGCDQGTGADGAARHPAADDVGVVPRQNDDRTRRQGNRRLIVHHQDHLALDQVVIGDDVARHRRERRAILRAYLGAHAPGGREFGIEKQPSGQAQSLQHVEQRIHGVSLTIVGGSGKTSGVPHLSPGLRRA
jgi:hypothetical protein